MQARVKERYEQTGLLFGHLPENEINHMLRVGILVEMLADKLTFISSEQARVFGEAACYHDVGKIYVPQRILIKNGELTETEWNLIKMHCVNGQIALNQISRYDSFVKDHLWLTTEGALFHHERWDGNGYPFGLTESHIPILGRLTSICDAYDAITNVRPYRHGKHHDEACEELERFSGIQFDPELVDIFLSCSLDINSLFN